MLPFTIGLFDEGDFMTVIWNTGQPLRDYIRVPPWMELNNRLDVGPGFASTRGRAAPSGLSRRCSDAIADERQPSRYDVQPCG